MLQTKVELLPEVLFKTFSQIQKNARLKNFSMILLQSSCSASEIVKTWVRNVILNLITIKSGSKNRKYYNGKAVYFDQCMVVDIRLKIKTFLFLVNKFAHAKTACCAESYQCF